MQIILKPLKGFRCFRDVYESGKAFYAKNLIAKIIFEPSSQMQLETINTTKEVKKNIYLGVTISKKIAKRAIIRNRIKRLLKESIRLLIKKYHYSQLSFIDRIILIYKKKPTYQKEIGLFDVIPAVKNILEQAIIFHNKKTSNKEHFS